MNKKYLIAGGIIAVLIIIFGIAFFSQQQPAVHTSSAAPSYAQNQSQATFHRTQTQQKVGEPTVTLAPPATTPQDATNQFYKYYVSSPSNPLANGAYKSNPYLSQDFKQVIGTLYKNGNTPVFCPENLRDNVVVGQEQQVNDTTGVLMQEVISDASSTKDLYRVMLKNVNGQWLIYDVNCIY